MHETSMTPAATCAAKLNLPRAKNSVNVDVSTRNRKRTPAIRALKRGDASAIRFIITVALMLFPPYASDWIRRSCESGSGFPIEAQPYRCGDRQWLSCCAGLLLPSLNVHAHHEQP